MPEYLCDHLQNIIKNTYFLLYYDEIFNNHNDIVITSFIQLNKINNSLTFDKIEYDVVNKNENNINNGLKYKYPITLNLKLNDDYNLIQKYFDITYKYNLTYNQILINDDYIDDFIDIVKEKKLMTDNDLKQTINILDNINEIMKNYINIGLKKNKIYNKKYYNINKIKMNNFINYYNK